MGMRATQEVREAYSIAEACEVGGFGKTTLYDMVNEGRLRVRKLGSKTLVLRSDLLQFLEALPSMTEGEEPAPAREASSSHLNRSAVTRSRPTPRR
jgi:excisionase family DNA binding protein